MTKFHHFLSFISVLSPFISDHLTLACSNTAIAAFSQPPNLRWNLLDDTGFMCARARSRLTFFPFVFPARQHFLLEPGGAAEPFSLSRARVMLRISGADVDGEGGGGGRFSPSAKRRLLIPLETTLEETNVRYTPEIRLMQL